MLRRDCACPQSKSFLFFREVIRKKSILRCGLLVTLYRLSFIDFVWSHLWLQLKRDSCWKTPHKHFGILWTWCTGWRWVLTWNLLHWIELHLCIWVARNFLGAACQSTIKFASTRYKLCQLARQDTHALVAVACCLEHGQWRKSAAAALRYLHCAIHDPWKCVNENIKK